MRLPERVNTCTCNIAPHAFINPASPRVPFPQRSPSCVPATCTSGSRRTERRARAFSSGLTAPCDRPSTALGREGAHVAPLPLFKPHASCFHHVHVHLASRECFVSIRSRRPVRAHDGATAVLPYASAWEWSGAREEQQVRRRRARRAAPAQQRGVGAGARSGSVRTSAIVEAARRALLIIFSTS
jgi:hypothetical protein